MKVLSPTAALFALSLGACGDRSAIVDPSPDVAGTWSLARTVLSAEGCDLLLEPIPTPVEIVIREIDPGDIEIDVPVVAEVSMTLAGSVGSDGDFEVRDSHEESGLVSESFLVEGTFAGEVFTGIENSEIRFFAPELIELTGTERCRVVIRWEGERV
ncbi:MAG TPA: hypothetical protein VFH11_02795 [Gemmatimonadota bacterium]|nr:hypothetical protein [Gemmatimonadota bacterium]